MREPKQNKQNSRLRKWFTTRALKDGNRISSLCADSSLSISSREKKKDYDYYPVIQKIKSTSYRASMLLLWLLFSWFEMGKKCSARPHVKHFSRSSRSTRLPILIFYYDFLLRKSLFCGDGCCFIKMEWISSQHWDPLKGFLSCFTSRIEFVSPIIFYVNIYFDLADVLTNKICIDQWNQMRFIVQKEKKKEFDHHSKKKKKNIWNIRPRPASQTTTTIREKDWSDCFRNVKRSFISLTIVFSTFDSFFFHLLQQQQQQTFELL